MSSWSNLPEEILILIFKERGLNQKQLLLCMTVCKGWKLAAQRIAYRCLAVNVLKFNNISTAFEDRDLEIRQLVKEIFLHSYKKDSEIFSKENLETCALLFPQVEKIISNNRLAVLHNLVDICTNEKWKYLKTLPRPLVSNELVPYTTCICACKNSILHLDLIGRTRLDRASKRAIPSHSRRLELFHTRRNEISIANQQYDILESQLSNFKNLESLSILRHSVDRLQEYDSTIEKCARLKNLCFDNFYKTSIQPTMTFSALAQVKKRPDITSFTGNFRVTDEMTLEYIMHKFQNLKNFNLNSDGEELYEKSATNLTTKTFVKFMSFATKISNHHVTMLVDKSFISALFEHDSLKNIIEDITIRYSWGIEDYSDREIDDIDENQVLVRSYNKLVYSGISFSLNYSSFNTQLPHLEIIQNYGHLLKKLDFGIEFQKDNDRDDDYIVKMVDGYYLGHLLKHCPNLERLNLYIESNFTQVDPDMSENHTINTLSIEAYPHNWQLLLFEVSVKLVSLKFLDLSIIEYLERNGPVFIDMPYSNLERLKITGDIPNRKTKISIKISTKFGVRYFLYHSFGGREIISCSDKEEFEEITKEVANLLSSGDLNIEFDNWAVHLRCNSIKRFYINKEYVEL